MNTRHAANEAGNTLNSRGTQTTGQFPGVCKPAIVGDLLLSLVIIFALAACIPAEPPLKESIVGHWVNEEGGVIDFYAGSTGHIPPFEEGNLPSYAFSYTIPDETHIAIKFEGVADELVVGIRIEDDKMTWRNPSTGAETVYTRGK